jgi:hypothetical protein
MDPGDGQVNINQTVPEWSNYYWLIDSPVGDIVPWNQDKMTRTTAGPGMHVGLACML